MYKTAKKAKNTAGMCQYLEINPVSFCYNIVTQFSITEGFFKSWIGSEKL